MVAHVHVSLTAVSSERSPGEFRTATRPMLVITVFVFLMSKLSHNIRHKHGSPFQDLRPREIVGTCTSHFHPHVLKNQWIKSACVRYTPFHFERYLFQNNFNLKKSHPSFSNRLFIHESMWIIIINLQKQKKRITRITHSPIADLAYVVVCLVCLCVALWCTVDLSRVYPASRPTRSDWRIKRV